MNILVTINRGYIKYLKVLLKSIVKSNPKEKFVVYVIHKDLLDSDIDDIRSDNGDNIEVRDICIGSSEIDKFPVYSKRYPVEIYFRLFATKYLPSSVEKILYLDTDIVVINSLRELYDMDFDDNYYIATSNVDFFVRKFNEFRLGMDKQAFYVNSGVMMMNLKELRKVDIEGDIRSFLRKKSLVLMLPDQDILSALYGDKVKIVDSMKYNLGDRGLSLYNLKNSSSPIDLKWVKNNAVIIHYYGKNKPWRDNYKGILNCFYDELVEEVNSR